MATPHLITRVNLHVSKQFGCIFYIGTANDCLPLKNSRITCIWVLASWCCAVARLVWSVRISIWCRRRSVFRKPSASHLTDNSRFCAVWTFVFHRLLLAFSHCPSLDFVSFFRRKHRPDTYAKMVNVRFTYKAPQAACAASSALCITGRAVFQPRPQVKPALTNYPLQPYRRTYP